MTDKRARILQFVLERRKLITAKVIAKQFLIAQSTAATHLRELHDAGHITRQQVGGQVFWGRKDADTEQIETPPVPVAVSSDVVRRAPEPEPEVVQVRPHRPTPVDWEPPKPIWPENPFKTSYPHVRGYDD